MKICVLVCLYNHTIIKTLKQMYEDHKNNIQLFLYNDAVFLLNEPEFLELTKYVKTILCSVSAEERHVGKVNEVIFGSLYDLSTMIAASDRLISFTRES